MQRPNSTRIFMGAMAGSPPRRVRLPVSPSACRGGRLGVFIPSRLDSSKRAVARTSPLPRRVGMTLLEMVIAMAIVVVILTAILPAFRSIRNSWDSKQAAAETLQNSRVLIDHLNFNLSKAVMITDVSASPEPNGYIQFEDNDGNNWRYEIGAGSLVKFGLVGSLSDLAGPVSQLQFTCYDGNDFVNPTTDVNSIRFVDVNTTLTNSATLGQDKTFTASIYLRTNSSSIWELNKGTNFEFDAVRGQDVALAQIDGTHYLCAYIGNGSNGYAVVLTVDTNLGITKGTPHQYTTSDFSDGRYPALAKIDNSNYLCVYRTKRSADGTYLQYAVVLTVDTGTWTVTERAPSTPLDPTSCKYHSMVKLNDSNYLCVYYHDPGNAGYAEALRVDTSSWTITHGTPFNYDSRSKTPKLAKIDNTHCLCVYNGTTTDAKGAWAVVLTVDPNLGVTKGTPFHYDTGGGVTPAISQIDDTHYLCAYVRSSSYGYATVLIVNTGDWTISKGASFQFEPAYTSAPVLAKIDSTHYLCAYKSSGANSGRAVILTVNTGDWTVSKEQASLGWESVNATEPALAKVNEDVNDALFLCAYEGGSSHGWSVMLEATKIRP